VSSPAAGWISTGRVPPTTLTERTCLADMPVIVRQQDRREVAARCLLYYRGDAPHAEESRAAYSGSCLSVRSEPRVRACLDLRTRS
jgi:hypothetical protein